MAYYITAGEGSEAPTDVPDAQTEWADRVGYTDGIYFVFGAYVTTITEPTGTADYQGMGGIVLY